MLYLIVVVAVFLLGVRFSIRALHTRLDSPPLTDNVSACVEVQCCTTVSTRMEKRQ